MENYKCKKLKAKGTRCIRGEGELASEFLKCCCYCCYCSWMSFSFFLVCKVMEISLSLGEGMETRPLEVKIAFSLEKRIVFFWAMKIFFS